ncbi:putative tetratricopeptide-like repeat protein Mbb1 [Dioscorea sansibarensis]
MQLFSCPNSSQLPFFSSPSSNPNPNPSFSLSPCKIPFNGFSSLPLPLLKPPKCSSQPSPPSPLQSDVLLSSDGEEEDDDELEGKDKAVEGVLKVRRPAKGFMQEDDEASSLASLKINSGLQDLAKKMPVFEPQRVEMDPKERPLGVNLELGLYRAKVLTRNFQFKEAEKILRKCILFWPEDGRPYVALGKLLTKQSKFGEARTVYEKGCQATQGENPYIWQCWAVLENNVGNIRKARELFDAATVADKRHVAAWHGWAVLEIKQNNIKKARNLLGKGLEYCGGNEYIYQTLALLEAKGSRFEQARYLFKQATLCNPKSCASWLAWAQVEMQQENNYAARKLFEKAVQASPKNRFAWHVWAIFEANQGGVDKAKKLLKIGHALNPRDPVLLQSLALLEYKHASANLARAIFRKASEIDPKHQPVWMAWGWMEWKEGNLSAARALYQRALSINSTTESAARCLQAWGVLEQRDGNLLAARRLFRSSLNINSQSYITWMTWASLEEEQGNSIRAEEIRDLYFQQRTEIVDDASWVMGFLDIIDPALDSIKRLLSLGETSDFKASDIMRKVETMNNNTAEASSDSLSTLLIDTIVGNEENAGSLNNFDLDAFVRNKLSLDVSKLDEKLYIFEPKKTMSYKRSRRSEPKEVALRQA